jgi:hypothetical protein
MGWPAVEAIHVLPDGFHRIRYFILISFIFLTIFQFDPRINTLKGRAVLAALDRRLGGPPR